MGHQNQVIRIVNGTVWYGTVWYGTVWYGMVWYGMVWYGMVWYGMVWYGMVWYGMVWYGIKGLCQGSPQLADTAEKLVHYHVAITAGASSVDQQPFNRLIQEGVTVPAHCLMHALRVWRQRRALGRRTTARQRGSRGLAGSVFERVHPASQLVHLLLSSAGHEL
jgi:hypothetical protein